MPVGRAIVTSMPSRVAGLARELLAFELRHLIDVARLERRVFVGRRMLDVAVDADGAAVNDPPRRRLRAAASTSPRTAVALTARYVSVEMPACAIDRGDVIDDVDAGDRVAERTQDRGGRPTMSSMPADSSSPRPFTVAHQRANLTSLRRQRAREVAAGESGGAGD